MASLFLYLFFFLKREDMSHYVIVLSFSNCMPSASMCDLDGFLILVFNACPHFMCHK